MGLCLNFDKKPSKDSRRALFAVWFWGWGRFDQNWAFGWRILWWWVNLSPQFLTKFSSKTSKKIQEELSWLRDSGAETVSVKALSIWLEDPLIMCPPRFFFSSKQTLSSSWKNIWHSRKLNMLETILSFNSYLLRGPGFTWKWVIFSITIFLTVNTCVKMGWCQYLPLRDVFVCEVRKHCLTPVPSKM